MVQVGSYTVHSKPPSVSCRRRTFDVYIFVASHWLDARQSASHEMQLDAESQIYVGDGPSLLVWSSSIRLAVDVGFAGGGDRRAGQ